MLHLSATAFGGGVAEILYTLVPLMQDAGLDVEWRVIQGQDEFFDVTKTIHNALQGDPTGLTSEQQEIFEAYQLLNAEALEVTYDFVIVHDLQPSASSSMLAMSAGTDLALPHRPLGAESLGARVRAALICAHDAAIFHRRQYAGAQFRADGVDLAAGDRPLAPKNMALSAEDAAYIVDQFGIDVHRPLVTQVSRFDPGKTHSASSRLGDCAAVATGAAARPGGADGARRPGGREYYNRTVAAADGDPDIFILSNLNNVGSVEVNAFQGPLAAVLQKSIREGFGLTVTEALWKSRPVVAGRVGGIVDQLQDGVMGYLVSSVEECAEKTRLVLDTPAQSRELALRGKEHVRWHYSSPVARLARAFQRAGGERRRRGGAGRVLADRLAGRVALWCPQDGGPAQAHRRLQPRARGVRPGRERRARSPGAEAAAS